MNNQEQIFYITYRQDDGYLNGMINQDRYKSLTDDEKKNYTQVIVDLHHLAGWGRYWDHVQYKNGALVYPDIYPKDQTATIDDLKNQLSEIVKSNNDKQKSNEDLQKKLGAANDKIDSANGQITELKELSSQLQLQVANATNEAKKAAKSNQGGNDNVSK